MAVCHGPFTVRYVRIPKPATDSFREIIIIIIILFRKPQDYRVFNVPNESDRFIGLTMYIIIYEKSRFRLPTGRSYYYHTLPLILFIIVRLTRGDCTPSIWEN